MIKKENHFLFYAYFILFIGLAYLGREYLSPTKNYFPLYMQIVTIIILPYLYRQFLPSSRFVAGVCFFLFFVMMWEISNFIFVAGLGLSVLSYHYANINLGFSWAEHFLKPAIIIGFLAINSNSLLLFFNALIADKKYIFSFPKIEFSKIVSDPTVDSDKLYAPEISHFYFNELTQILTIFFNKNSSSFLKKHVSVSSKNLFYFFLRKKNNVNGNQLKVIDGLLYIHTAEQILLFNYNEFPLSLKDIVQEIINEDKNS